MKSTIRSVKGTRDFYPEDMRVRNWLYRTIKRVSEAFGYQEYDGPFLETLELFAAKSGEELVKKQAFLFQDRGGNWITLRPELTPSLARMVAERQGSLTFPLRWWSFGPAVDNAELERELQAMKQAGIGGVEVQPVYPLALDNPTAGFHQP